MVASVSFVEDGMIDLVVEEEKSEAADLIDEYKDYGW